MQSNSLSRRQFLKLAGAGAASTFVLAACAAPAGAPAAAPAAGGGAAPAAEPVTLTFGHTWEASFQAHQAEWDKKFLEKHPNTKIEITNNTWGDHNQIVPTWAAANTLPDIIYTHGRYAFPWNFEGIMKPDHGLHRRRS